MSSSKITVVASLAIAAGAAWGAYAWRQTLLVCVPLALVAVVLLAVIWSKARRGRADTLHDPAASTLIFPPESKFQRSVLPKR